MTEPQQANRLLDQFPVRMPDGMRPAIKRVAKENRRSMNNEIVLRLERSLKEDGIEYAEKE